MEQKYSIHPCFIIKIIRKVTLIKHIGIGISFAYKSGTGPQPFPIMLNSRKSDLM